MWTVGISLMQFILLFKLNIYLIADMFTSSGMPSLLIDSAMNEGAMIFLNCILGS